MMMISRALGRSICSRRSIRVGIRNSTSVSTHRNTFSKFRLKIWAIITPMTDRRKNQYTTATTRFFFSVCRAQRTRLRKLFFSFIGAPLSFS